MYDSFGELVVCPDRFGKSRADVSASQLDIGVSTAEEGIVEQSVPKHGIKAVLESWFFCFLLYWFFFVALHQFSSFFSGDADFAPRVSISQDISTGVETDGQLTGRRMVVTGGLVTLIGAPA